MIQDLDILPPSHQSVLYQTDRHGRSIRVFKLEDAQPVGQIYYPGVRLFSFHDSTLYNPIRERIMSIPDVTPSNLHMSLARHIEEQPVFFFVYNVDNYYHFVYDTLPYLITYNRLKKTIPNLKLLVNYANEQQFTLNRFVLEFLELLDIGQSDLLFIDKQTIYRTVYISSSYTHDGLSNGVPRQEVYDLYQELAGKVDACTDMPQKIYISRRSQKHGQLDNMGTNYTLKRRFVNEDDVVSFVETLGYQEVFTELLDTREKIALFKNCTHVIGPIGGGLCNVLFSRPSTKLMAIVSPGFLMVNRRFSHSFVDVKTTYFYDTEHFEVSPYKKNMRVRIKSSGIIGEIAHVEDARLCVIYSNDVVAGWNSQVRYERAWVTPDDVEIIDDGLNAAWIIDMHKFREAMAHVY